MYIYIYRERDKETEKESSEREEETEQEPMKEGYDVISNTNIHFMYTVAINTERKSLHPNARNNFLFLV